MPRPEEREAIPGPNRAQNRTVPDREAPEAERTTAAPDRAAPEAERITAAPARAAPEAERTAAAPARAAPEAERTAETPARAAPEAERTAETPVRAARLRAVRRRTPKPRRAPASEVIEFEFERAALKYRQPAFWGGYEQHFGTPGDDGAKLRLGSGHR